MAAPGPTFLRHVLEPITRSGAALHAGRVPEALDLLTPDRLLYALGRGISATARDAGKGFDDVKRILPGGEIDALLDGLAASQAAAANAWQAHARTLGGLLSGIGEVTADAEADVGGALSRLAAKVVRDKTLSGPLDGLAIDVTRWEELARRCGALLDQAKVLRRGRLFKRLRMLALLVAAAMTAIVVSVLLLREKAQRARIASALSAADRCTTLPDDDLARTSAEQKKRYDDRHVECARRRERTAYEARCAALAAAVDGGKLDPNLTTFAGASASLLNRVASRALDAADLADAPTLPCRDAPGADRIPDAFGRAAASSTTAWATVDRVAEPVAAMLRDKHPLEEGARAALGD